LFKPGVDVFTRELATAADFGRRSIYGSRKLIVHLFSHHQAATSMILKIPLSAALEYMGRANLKGSLINMARNP
jgi:hypothetical protein